jgi:D-alanyl-D-alanine carboxypeptidase
MPDSGTAAPPSLRQLAKGLVAAGAPGAVVYVRDARGSRAGTAGYANLRTKERLGTTHVFRVGSITKTFVATVVLQLEAEGVLGLDDSLERWLPGLVPNGGAITLRQLLNHTSGIYNYTEDPAFSRSMARNPRASWTPEALVNVATAHRPLFAPGTDWSYSNTGYILLGLVIEKATGRSLGAELARRIFRPLGLSRTSFPAGTVLAPPFAHGYLPPGSLIPTSRGRPADITAWNPSSAWASGAIVSSAPDLARFYAALLGGKLLAPAELRELRKIVPGSDQYALGIKRGQLACADAWGHGGSVPGYRTLAYSSDDGSRQAIVMVNGMSRPGSDLGPRFGAALESAFCR